MKADGPLGWLRGYRREYLQGDAVAGLTTAVMLVPQSMGYALLAGLPPIVGLYASLAPLLAYACLGTSRQLAVGPVAMDSILVAATVGAMASQGSDAYVALAVTLAALVGLIHMSLGLARAGFVVNFLSRPVIAGFTSAAAIVIATSQLPHLVGMKLARGPVYERWWQLAQGLPEWHWPTFALAAGGAVLLQTLKKQAPRVPRALVVVGLATLAVHLLELDQRGVAVVGDVPAGLPPLTLPHWSWDQVQVLFPGALAIALVAFMETISVGAHFAKVERYDIRPSRELIAIGAANLASAFTGGYPIAGGVSRSAVNGQAGAKTQLSGVITAGVVALTLLLLTPLFRQLPIAILATIIILAVGGLIDVAEAKRLWKVKRSDFALLALTFFTTLALGIQEGILLGVGASLLLFVVRTTQPHVAVLGRIPDTTAYLNVKRHPHAQTVPGVLIVRLDAQLYFGNVSFLKETLRTLEAEASEPLYAVVLDASGINNLDSSAEAALCEVDDDYQSRGIMLLWAHVKGPVRDVMTRAGFLQRLGTKRLLLNVHDAVQRAQALHEGTYRPTDQTRHVTASSGQTNHGQDTADAPTMAHPAALPRYHI